MKAQDYPKIPLNCLIEEQAGINPQKAAIIFEQQTITYSELNERANRFAHYLWEQGINFEYPIGIYLNRSIDMVAAILAVVKMGGTYIPLDSSYPYDRIRYIINDAKIALVITENSLLADIQNIPAQKLVLEDIHEKLPGYSPDNPGLRFEASKRLYVIYTSGSTGNPKGVQISHQAVVNFLMSMRKEPGISAEDKVLFITTICFDISGLELYLPLISGATMVMATSETAADGVKLAEYIDRHDVTLMQATPSTYRILIDTNWKGKQNLKLLCGGEALTRELAEVLLTKGSSVWNLYGPTETTIWSMIYRVEHGEGPVSIGKPIDNTQIYILNEAMEEVAEGEVGELYIGGDGLSMGYLGRPELTGERFVLNPLADGSERIYRTGDLARREKGLVYYEGRTDFQVKIRGYRIELGEIENTLEKHPLVKQAVAVALESKAGDAVLAVYYTRSGAQPVKSDVLRTYLKSKLPEYMVPSLLTELEAFPLTLNGKIDRKSLMSMGIEPEKPQNKYVPPTSPLEKEIAQLWEEMLELSCISIDENFLELGGHSLLANRMLARINRTYDIRLTLMEFLTEGLTIADLSRLIEIKLLSTLSESDMEEMMSELEGITEEEMRRLINS
jgi:amino acid adenylation domain-containing protein